MLRTKSVAFLALICLSIGLPATTRGKRAVTTDTAACKLAAAWVEAHASELPTTLDQFVRTPPEYRVATFNALSPEIRSRLWQEHLSRFAGRADLSDPQRQFAIKALNVVTPDLYRKQNRTAEQQRAHDHLHVELNAEAAQLFTPQQIRAFGVLGHLTASEGTFIQVRRMLGGVLEACNCNRSNDFCALDCAGISCIETPSGCGWFNCDVCDGRCI